MADMNEDGQAPLQAIGDVAARCGLSVKAVRFYSDAGLVPPVARSAAGYRLYDASSVARLDLVRTLRALGLGLPAIRDVLDGRSGLGGVAAAHADALDAQIRLLRLRRAVLRTAARTEPTSRGIQLMHRLATLSAEERQAILDEFHDHVFGGLDTADKPREAMRAVRADLPADPSPEQVEAWVELAELVRDPGFRERVRGMAEAGAQSKADGAAAEPDEASQRLAAQAADAGRAALADGVAPDSAEGLRRLEEALDRAGADPAPAERERAADDFAAFTDARVERYYALLGVINGTPAFPPAVPAFEWFIAALRASAR